MTDDEFKRLLNERQNEQAGFLHFTPCLEMLMNSDYCKALNDLLARQGANWERMKATPALGPMLPDEMGLYMFVWKPDFALRFDTAPKTEQPLWVLYVGKAGKEDSANATIRNRYLGEYCKYVGRDANCLWDSADAEKREELLARYLTLRPLEFWYLPMTDADEITRLEKKLIQTLRPPLNKQHGAKLRSGKPQPVV